MSYATTNQEPNVTASAPSSIADLETEIHGNLLEMREMLKSYLGRMYGQGAPENETTQEPTCFIQSLALDAHLSAVVMKLLKELCAGLGV